MRSVLSEVLYMCVCARSALLEARFARPTEPHAQSPTRVASYRSQLKQALCSCLLQGGHSQAQVLLGLLVRQVFKRRYPQDPAIWDHVADKVEELGDHPIPKKRTLYMPYCRFACHLFYFGPIVLHHSDAAQLLFHGIFWGHAFCN